METRRHELEERLGRWRTAAGRELEALTDATAGEEVAAAVYAAWRRRAWIVVATERGLHMSRRPRVFGRNRDVFRPWSELRGVNVSAQRLSLEFADETIELSTVAPQRELARLADTARDAVAGARETTRGEDLRELAEIKLGRLLAYGLQAPITSLPDHLLDGERVERLASARLDFDGLLVVTDRRVILCDVKMQPGKERVWEVPRGDVMGAEAVGDGLRLELRSGAVTFTRVLPDDRRDELAAALWRG